MGRSGSTSQPSQLANTGRNSIDNAPGICPRRSPRCCERRRAPRSCRRLARLISGQTFERRHRRVQARAAPIHLRQPCEIARERTEPRNQLFDEGILVGHGEHRVGRAFAADRRRALRGTGCRAERARAMRRIHPEVVGQRQDLVAQGSIELTCEVVAEFRPEQVGSPDRPDHERAAAEQRRRSAGLTQR